MIKKFMIRENIKQRLIQLLILIAHLVLLKWILYTLSEGGILPLSSVLYHFLGISLYGALLIRSCAYIYKKQYLKELQQSERDHSLDS